jgi:formylglycine-generating enzyme required for sulfatase activity
MFPATWFRLIGLAVVLALLSLCAPAWTEPAEGTKVALLVGVKEYKRSNLFPDLQYTENDVEKLATVLRSGTNGFTSVRLLTTTRGAKKVADAPTAANIRKELLAVLADRGPRDTVLVALAGHGVTLEVADPDGKRKNRSYSFFCPSDSDLVGVSYSTGRTKTLLNLDELFGSLGRCGAGAKLVLVDACRNEVELKKEWSTRSLNARGVSIPTGVGALFSCSSGQYAYESKRLEHGVFFHFVLKGLKGGARNDRKEVTWGRLVEYVTEQVSDEAPRLLGAEFKQTPHPIGNLPGKSPVLISPEEEKVVKPWEKDVRNAIGMRFVRIRSGKFMMGSTKEERKKVLASLKKQKEMPNWLGAEGPQHEVVITRDYWLGIHEVTQKQFMAVMGYNPSYFSHDGKGKAGVNYGRLLSPSMKSDPPAGGKHKVPSDTSDFPVENVSWEEANEFCKKLTASVGERGRKYRLPTEAEWEYACRAGSSSHQYFSFGNAISSQKANFKGTHPFGTPGKGKWNEHTVKVGSYEKNAFGLYDMHGNVWEWCADWYGEDYYRKSEKSDPQGPASGAARVIRGGGWEIDGGACRSACRDKLRPTWWRSYVGFRVVVVPSSE